MSTEINDLPTKEELLERYAKIQGISFEEAKEQIDAPTAAEILKNIKEKTLEKIKATNVAMNREQRRALKKKVGAKKYNEIISNGQNPIEIINETATKLNYIDLIQKLRRLNEQKEKEEQENENENERN